jgi:acetyltransferase-like isoleucine patch superfamily enzyme
MGGVDENVVLVRWMATVGDAVEAGDVIAVVETQKAAFELEADDDLQILRQLFAEGDSVSMQAAYVAVADKGAGEVDEASVDSLIASEGPAESHAAPEVLTEAEPLAASSSVTGGNTPAVPAARRLARARGIDLSAINGSGPRGMVTVADVEAHRGCETLGRVDAAFMNAIRADERTFAALTSAEKIQRYRDAGADIGEGVSFGKGSVILADAVCIGARVTLRDGVRLECVDISVGELTYFGPGCRLRVRRAEIAENVFFTSDVDVGGGGAMDPDSLLVIGPHGFVGENVHLNPCSGLVIGEEVTLSRDARLMTHSFAQSVLEGFPNAFAPVHVGSFSQIGIGAVLFPGVKIGEGAVVLSNSTVVTDVRPGRLVGGVPAVDIKAAALPMSPDAVAAKAIEIVRAFVARIEAGGRVDVGDEGNSGHWLTWEFTDRGVQSQLIFTVHPDAPLPQPLPGLSRVVCVLGDLPDLDPTDAGVSLLRKKFVGSPGLLSNSLRESMRKRGIRLSPRCWTYESGWL